MGGQRGLTPATHVPGPTGLAIRRAAQLVPIPLPLPTADEVRAITARHLSSGAVADADDLDPEAL